MHHLRFAASAIGAQRGGDQGIVRMGVSGTQDTEHDQASRNQTAENDELAVVAFAGI
jgi:hypothetical protein